MKGGFTVAPSFALQFHRMGSFRRPRPRFMSSPVLSDLPRFQAARQAMQLSSNSAWNSVQTAVINVFKGGGLQNNELYTLNENIRRLLKSELGSFITDYFQNQLLAKGLLFMEEKVKLCEGEDRIDVLSEIWDHYFTETLPTLQAIFYPVQGQELTIRQIALLGFRDLVLLKVKLEEILPLVQTKLPASIVQMLLILQSVHEPTGPSEGYLQLEELVKQVVSPYLGLCEDHSSSGSTCLLERRYSRSRPKTDVLNYPSHATTRQPSEMALTPLTEQEGEAYLEKCGSIRRHTVANAHSDIQLLAMASMMHTGMVIEESDSTDKCLLLQPACFSHRQCSSEPSIADGPEGIGAAASRQDSAELNCTSVS
ncbi:proline-rich protein 5-like isoform X1 [Manacus vitellinus]|uniref:proline-rich protein 5-like isoform X1 n=1 Tax=Manacus vitellinus TaxID=328815 RepID=UPI0004EFE084|nr:proline-rich protein 5-like isoform X1 [Manacus vitellinus]XP_051660099.1 proline-rich protein 5-like isoform X1 [Manacus candei]XP_051660101.1 proline-rich protein 5-like isoform X1 [Manacus candei]XP_051660102.1 proline-rich protein 5-like isoform X1 [Manacus candei]